MAKKKIHRLNKEFYVADEYGHTDAVLVQKVNELIGIVNHQQDVIRSFELMMRDMRNTRRLNHNEIKRFNRCS